MKFLTHEEDWILRVNREIRSLKVRVIDKDGEQLGVMSVPDALSRAEAAQLDLVEIAPNAEPPVCKIIDFGKYRYKQTKKEKESKRAQHQIKIKEVKVKPNIDEHDFQVKLRRARDFIEKGFKVRLTCAFRGREMLRKEFGQKVIDRFCELLIDVATAEAAPKQMGRNLSLTLAPSVKKKT